MSEHIDEGSDLDLSAMELLEACRTLLRVRAYAQSQAVDGYAVTDEVLRACIEGAHAKIAEVIAEHTGLDPVDTENGAILGYLTISGLAFGALMSLTGLPPEIAMILMDAPGPDPDVDTWDDDEPTVN